MGRGQAGSGDTVAVLSRAALAAGLAVLLVVGRALGGGVTRAHANLKREGVLESQALLLLEDGTDLAAVAEAIERAGGHVRHIFPPSALIGHFPTTASYPAGVRAAFREPVKSSAFRALKAEERRAAETWNRLLASYASLDENEPQTVGTEGLQAELVGDAFVPPAASDQLTADVRDPTPDDTQTSEFLIGRVAVGIVLPESDGGIDASTEDWTDDERGLVLSEITAALDWWAGLEPRAGLTFVYDDGTAAPVSTNYEPISRPYSDQSLWIGDVMDRKGYVGSSYFDQVRQYNQHLRATHGTDWAFTIFVVDSYEDEDNRFADGSFAYAYLGGPFTVVTSGSNGYGPHNLDAVVAHEIGHVFSALDQYQAARQPCTRRSGYLGVENQNSEYGDCASDQPSIMRGQTWPFRRGALDDYARGQIGWRDSDGDGILDPVDTSIIVESADYEAGVSRSNVFTFTGEIRDEPYPSPVRESVTINTIDSVEYRVVGGDWRDAHPADEAFDSYAEGFTFTTAPLPTGDLDVELRVIDSAGNVVTQTVATVPAEDPLDGILETTLDRVGPQALSQPLDDLVYRGSGTSSDTAFVAGVYYRIDDGAWGAVPAEDGAFDEPEEDFILSVRLEGLSPGEHRVEVYAEDSDGNPDTSPAHDVFTVSSRVQHLFLPLVATSY